MSIAAECPHCETRFHLQPELAGRTMRCPNPDCRQVFEVAAALPPLPTMPRDDSTPPFRRPEPEVVEAQLAPAPPKARPKPPKPARPPKVVEAEVVSPGKPKTSAGPKEVVWTPGADLPPSAPPPAAPPPPKPRAVADYEEPYEEPVRRRRKRGRNLGPAILLGLVVLLVLVGGAAGVYILQYKGKVHEQAVAKAKDLYKAGDYTKAKKAYDELAAEYADHADVDEYKFFSDLAQMQQATRGLTTRENPRPAIQALKDFVAARKDAPLAKPDKFGYDVFDAGKKVAEDAAAYVQERVKGFGGDRGKLDELAKADELIAAGRELPALVEPFRPKDLPGLDDSLAKFAAAEADIGKGRRVFALIDQAKAQLAEPTEQAMVETKAFLAAHGLTDHPEARDLMSRSEAEFLRRVAYTADPAGPAPPAAEGRGSFLFVAPVGAAKAVPRGQLDDPPTVFLAVARGVLYALDEDSGDLLWAARVGADTFDPPAVVTLETADGPTNLALVLGNVAGQAEASGRVLKTGEVKWRQLLPAPAAGPAAVVGGRAFVPVRDGVGTVVVINLTTGAREGRIVLGQPVAQVVARTGSQELFVAADARRVFVFDCTAGANPRCVRVMATNHPAGSLRTTPVMLGPRYLMFCQADGPSAMALRVFPVLDTPALAADAPPVTEPVAPAVQLPVPGWVWFPPVSDGERLAAVTDAGQFRLFGVNLPGNSDPALFALPSPTLPTPPDGAPVPGLAVPAEDGAFWVLAGSSLQKYRLRLHPVRGLELVADGKAEPVGSPTQPVQLNPKRDTACFVVRSGNSSGCRAVAVRLRDGEPRWRRQLGLVPGGAPVSAGDGVLLADEDGGVVSIPAAAVATQATNPATVVATGLGGTVSSGPGAATGPTAVATGPNGQVFTLTPTAGEKGPQWSLRVFTNGAATTTATFPAPGAVAGVPLVLNGNLLIPASDGSLYRYKPGDASGRSEPLGRGPTWLTDRRGGEPVCYLAALDGDHFAASDGGRALNRWLWPGSGMWSSGDLRWELRDRVASVPAYFAPKDGRPSRLLVAEATGGVWLYAADRGGPALRSWLPGRTVSLPGGRVGPFGVSSAGRVCYAVEGKADERSRWVVSLDPERADPAWVAEVAEPAVGAPVPLPDGRWLVTDRAGGVTARASDTGRPAGEASVGLPGAVPAGAGVPVGTAVLVPLTDGSAAVVPLPAPAKE
ncbi:MAG: PQQ-binding-like beta-propeller repeat protein [Gemmataceae bacterium]